MSTVTNYIAALTPGQPIIFSDVINLITNLPGVSSTTIATPGGNLYTNSSNQIFTPPSVVFPFSFDLIPDDTGQYVGQCPVFPLQPWAGTFTLNGNVITMLPSPVNGYAIFVGPGLSSQRYGLLSNRPTAATSNANTFWYDVQAGINYLSNGTVWTPANGMGSGVQLNSGQVRVSSTSSFSTMNLQLTLSAGYTHARSVNLYIAYTGTNTLTERNQIRGTLRNWNSGFQIGQSLFSSIMLGSNGTVLLDASRCNITDAVSTVPGVLSVDQVAIQSPGNTNNRFDVGSTELVVISDIILNGNLN